MSTFFIFRRVQLTSKESSTGVPPPRRAIQCKQMPEKTRNMLHAESDKFMLQ